ncbi:ADP-ribose 1''-phosphate phosphatase [Psilocybe cubensis]|uniref:ADP-ribose 1''-phosphate phosphatase n=2 Tax=Psilocybe cubensis TaxID=181762 RepID=A0A8H8CHT1_PSICU|nr:ADP-ribose 1''-phosphate phosphatase [Psilocybe cubensis]KAH9480582.1 ADP-ribose 1''-phosphate phosphatase [Psilocybe cubensis]
MGTNTISHIKASLFSAPAGTILVHACNTHGAWGSGIALAFRDIYPAAYGVYRAHCQAHGESLVGTCLLIPGDDAHDIACLFTSRAYGRRKDAPAQILAATRAAVMDLLEKNVSNKPLHACRFNSGKFGVPWQETEAVLKDLKVTMTVYSTD